LNNPNLAESNVILQNKGKFQWAWDRRWQVVYLVLVTTLLLLAFSHWAYDDPFITYRYANNLAKGLGFVYNPGARTLSTTTPLFAILLASFKFLWGDLPRFANLIGALSLVMGALFIWDLAQSWGKPSVGWAALALYPSTPLLLSTLGSETPLYLMFCLGAFAFYARRKYSPAALFSALAVLARPDGLLIAVVIAADFLLRRRQPIPWRAIPIFLIPLLAWFSFAWMYFGSPLPVTLAAKQGQASLQNSVGFARGFFSLAETFVTLPEHMAQAGLAALGLIALLRTARSWGLLIAWNLAYLTAYALLGVTNYFWYYAPLMPGFLALVGMGSEVLFDLLRQVYSRVSLERLFSGSLREHKKEFVGLILIILAIFQIKNAWNISQNPDRRFEIYRAAGEWLNENTLPNQQVGTLEVGIIGYYTANPLVDFAGLIQPQVADQFTSRTTFEDSALWALENLQPAYLVLHDGMMARLESSSAMESCRSIHRLNGSRYLFSRDLVIYNCQ
jgi:hypothetical protein